MLLFGVTLRGRRFGEVVGLERSSVWIGVGLERFFCTGVLHCDYCTPSCTHILCI